MSETQPDTSREAARPACPCLRLDRHGRPIRQNGPVIRVLRERDGWPSQTAFATAVGITQGFLSAIEIEIDSAPDPVLTAIAAKLRVGMHVISRDVPAPARETRRKAADTDTAAVAGTAA